MSKLSKKFRQIKVVKYIIEKKRSFFRKFRLYSFLRYFYLEQKWRFKFTFFPKYKRVKTYLSNKYSDIKVKRPRHAFSDFDIAVVAKTKKTGDKVFIQILFNDSKVNGGGDFVRKSEIFSLKNKYYNVFRDEAVRCNNEIGKHTIKAIEFNTENKYFSFFVSEYRDFIPIDYFIKTKEFKDKKNKNKELFLEQLAFYLSIFDRIKLYWHDPSIHNIMVVKDCGCFVLVPLDFVGVEEKDVSKIKNNNKQVSQHITKYILSI